MESKRLGEEVGSGGGHSCHWIGLLGVRGDMRLNEIVILTKPGGRRTLLVAVAEADKKKES